MTGKRERKCVDIQGEITSRVITSSARAVEKCIVKLFDLIIRCVWTRTEDVKSVRIRFCGMKF